MAKLRSVAAVSRVRFSLGTPVMEGYPKRNVKNEIPFDGVLVESDVSPLHAGFEKLHELEENSEKVIRSETFDTLEHRYGKQIEVLELVQIAKKLFEELESEYHIKTPVSFVVGKNKRGADTVYSIVDKIKGKKWEELVGSEEAVSQLQELYTSVARYYFEKRTHGGFYLTDIANIRQYVFGQSSTTTEENLYLVDTDIYFNKGERNMYRVVEWLTRHMCGVEQDFSIQLDAARVYIQKIIDEPIPETHEEKELKEILENIENIQRFLYGQRLEDEGPMPAIPPFRD